MLDRPEPDARQTPCTHSNKIVLQTYRSSLQTERGEKNFFKKYIINTDIYSNYPYEYTHVQSISMSTSKRLNQFNLEIHKVDH
jgi:hypothetical protein